MLILLLKMIKFNKNLEGNKQSDQENGGSCAKLSTHDLDLAHSPLWLEGKYRPFVLDREEIIKEKIWN